MLVALDLDTGKLTYRIHRRRRWVELMAFVKLLCAR